MTKLELPIPRDASRAELAEIRLRAVVDTALVELTMLYDRPDSGLTIRGRTLTPKVELLVSAMELIADNTDEDALDPATRRRRGLAREIAAWMTLYARVTELQDRGDAELDRHLDQVFGAPDDGTALDVITDYTADLVDQVSLDIEAGEHYDGVTRADLGEARAGAAMLLADLTEIRSELTQ